MSFILSYRVPQTIINKRADNQNGADGTHYKGNRTRLCDVKWTEVTYRRTVYYKRASRTLILLKRPLESKRPSKSPYSPAWQPRDQRIKVRITTLPLNEKTC